MSDDMKKTFLLVVGHGMVSKNSQRELLDVIGERGFCCILLRACNTPKPVELYCLDNLTPAEREVVRDVVKKHTGEDLLDV